MRLLLSLSFVLVSCVARADPQAIDAGRAIAANGTAGAPACADCHGLDGGAHAAFPRLAGLDAGYLGAQLAAFAAGTRQNPTMQSIAKVLDAKATAEVAAYYASLPPPAAPPASAATKPLGDAGAELAQRGDWSAGIPPCAACHGPNGRGVGPAFPAIAGQPASYIAAQLKAWQSGARHDDPQALMRTVAGRLSDAQIGFVSTYYATLPPLAGLDGEGRRAEGR